tara:strand:+ start:2726 stop:4729 length:2004 start_codon:yes stop_codon:yes gene_type:complete
MEEDKKVNGQENKPLGKTGIAELVELMQSNNKSTGEIEKDGRNTRRHLLEMKNMQKVMNDFQARSVYGFENFQDMIDSQKLQDTEDEKESKTIFQEIRDELRALPKETAQASAKESKGDGISSKLGGILKGAGFAAAGVGVGIAAVFATAPKLIDAFTNMDVKKISNQVSGLIGINKRVEEEGGNLLVDGGSFLIGMGFIGAGLALFAAGGAFASASDYFLKDGWVQTIQQNVSDLLAIGTNVSGSTVSALGESGAFFLSMSGLGAGLAIFAVGKAASGVAEAITMFTSGSNFAEDIKQEVATLLTIPDLPGAKLGEGGLATFIATMGGLMLGLLAFSIGKGVAGAADAATVTTMFQGSNFGADIRDEVKALLEIPSLPGANSNNIEAFKKTMGGLSLGLGLFAVGKGAAGIADFLTLTTATSGSNFATDLKDEVDTLLTVGQGADVEKSNKAAIALAKLGAGLGAFAVAKGINAFADMASGIAGFFTGAKNPVDQAIHLGEKSDEVQAGADAFGDFADALGRFSNIKVKFDADAFIKEAADSAKAIEAIMTGGKIEIPGLFNDKTIDPGLSELIPQMDAFSASMINMQNSITGGASSNVQRLQRLEGMMINNMSVENALLKIPQQQSPTNINAVGPTANSTSNNTVIVNNGTRSISETTGHLSTAE